MTIPFSRIPQNLRVPLFYAELDNSKANTATTTTRSLIIGQMLASGTATANVPVLCSGKSAAQAAAGVGSMLALMVGAYRKNDSFGELWILPLADAAAATKATGTVTITSAATDGGTIYLYIGGARIAQAVTSVQTTAQIATALAATINATDNMPVSAVAAANVVTLTAINAGTGGNEIDLRLNYLGAKSGEVLPTGLGITVVTMAGGATASDMTAALANLGDQKFEVIACPYTDTASLDAMKALMNDSTGRWSWSRKIYGHVVAAYRGTLGNATTFGSGRNDQHVSVLPFYDSPTPAWLWAAELAGQAAVSVRADAAQPIREVALAGVLAPPPESRFQLTDRNVLLWDGMSTFKVGDDGTVYIEKLVTTYQKNTLGSADNSYLDAETMFNLAYVLRQLETSATSNFSRVKLAADGTRFAPGSNIVTPSTIKASIIAKYQELEFNGFVQDSTTFAKSIIVEKDANYSNRVNVLWPGILIDRLDIFALLAQFRLS